MFFISGCDSSLIGVTVLPWVACRCHHLSDKDHSYPELSSKHETICTIFYCYGMVQFAPFVAVMTWYNLHHLLLLLPYTIYTIYYCYDMITFAPFITVTTWYNLHHLLLLLPYTVYTIYFCYDMIEFAPALTLTALYYLQHLLLLRHYCLCTFPQVLLLYTSPVLHNRTSCILLMGIFVCIFLCIQKKWINA
jgi:hypothetical protein